MNGVMTAGQYASSHTDLSRGTRVPCDNRSTQASPVALMQQLDAVARNNSNFHNGNSRRLQQSTCYDPSADEATPATVRGWDSHPTTTAEQHGVRA
jgi:hypothetical protein